MLMNVPNCIIITINFSTKTHEHNNNLVINGKLVDSVDKINILCGIGGGI